MANIVRRFFDWLERRSYAAHRRELERYLSHAGDIAELERRLRLLRRPGARVSP